MTCFQSKAHYNTVTDVRCLKRVSDFLVWAVSAWPFRSETFLVSRYFG